MNQAISRGKQAGATKQRDGIVCPLARSSLEWRGHNACAGLVFAMIHHDAHLSPTIAAVSNKETLHEPFVSPPGSANHSACISCAVNSRREFVQSAARGVAALLGLAVLEASTAAAQIIPLSEPANGLRGEARYPIPAADGVSIDSKNDVIIARAAGNAYAFALACPHQSTMLRWVKKDNRFQCPKHQSKYTPSGEFISGRATRNMDRLPIKLDGTSLVVDTSVEIRSDQDASGWAAAAVKIPA